VTVNGGVRTGFRAENPSGATLVAWWFDGALRNLSLVNLPPPGRGDRVAQVRQQLLQAAWAGELDGWLKTAPTWHLVADDAAAREWEPVLRQALDEPIQIVAPLLAADLTARTASRGARSGSQASLLPPEFAKRYQQQFVDRLWMRGLLAVSGAYVLGCLVYFALLNWTFHQKDTVQQQVRNLGSSYTNALQLKAKYQVLLDRQELKYAALDCWKLVAELLPERTELRSLNFTDGRKLSLDGNCDADQLLAVIEFSGALRKAKINDKAMFKSTELEPFAHRASPGAPKVTWSFALELNRPEAK
jgi:hypothetical protein